VRRVTATKDALEQKLTHGPHVVLSRKIVARSLARRLTRHASSSTAHASSSTELNKYSKHITQNKAQGAAQAMRK
jgi:hypothetical protein